MDNPNIRIGQKLKVKKQAAASGSQAGGSSRASAGLHTVSDGESLGVIAQKYGLSVADLKSLNNLQTNDIRIGQKLKVGGRAQASSSGGASASKAAGGYKVVEGDTLYSIARKNNLSVDELRKINKLEGNSLRLGQMLKLK